MDEFLATDFDVVRKLSEIGMYDYIIVGSGFGGGILAEELAQRKRKVLLIEKGGSTFSTHICNTARPDFARGRHDSPEGNETIYNKLKAWVQIVEDSEPFVGGPLYCLGGRSLVWGLWIPRTDDGTLAAQFPKVVADELSKTWFARAFNLVTNNSQTSKVYPDGIIPPRVLADAKAELTTAIKSYLAPGDAVGLGPIATELLSPAPYRFPQGAYSTVVPLLNRMYSRDEYLTVLLGAEVLSLDIPNPVHLANTTKSVRSLEVRQTATQRLYQISTGRAKVILSAGTLCTANIALNSGLQLDQPLVGKGLIDHSIWAVRFARRAAPTSRDPINLQTMITIFRSKPTRALLTVTINNNFYLAGSTSLPIQQYLERDGTIISPTKGRKAIETDAFDTINIVLEFGADLDDDNKVINDGSPNPTVRLRRRQTHSDVISQFEMQLLATQIRNAVISKVLTDSSPPVGNSATLPKGTSGPGPVLPECPTLPEFYRLSEHIKLKLLGEIAPPLSLLGSGIWAHEVGTMRMDRPLNRPGVVDTNLQVHGFSKLYVCDMSVLPCSPPANPALTLAALSLRLAEHLEPRPRPRLTDRVTSECVN